MPTEKLKIVFMGTPEFSLPAMQSLMDAGHDIICAYTQPPRKSGRGQKLHLTPVHAFAESQGIEVRTPKSLKGEAEQRAFADLGADVGVVVAYGLILPKALLEVPRLGCLNIHASLLPRWRGAAPIQRAIMAGDEKTGITIMQMDAGLDTGPAVMGESMPIPFSMNAENLHDALSKMGGRMIVAALVGLVSDRIKPEPQAQMGVAYAKKIDKNETRMDWTRPAIEVLRQVRGLYPLAWFEWGGQRIRVLEACVVDGTGAPGVALDEALLVACGTGAVRLEGVQPAGKSAMTAAAFLNGHPVAANTRLDERLDPDFRSGRD